MPFMGVEILSSRVCTSSRISIRGSWSMFNIYLERFPSTQYRQEIFSELGSTENPLRLLNFFSDSPYNARLTSEAVAPFRPAWKGRAKGGSGATFAVRPTALTHRAKGGTATL